MKEIETRKIVDGSVSCEVEIDLPDGGTHRVNVRVPLHLEHQIKIDAVTQEIVTPAILDKKNKILESEKIEIIELESERFEVVTKNTTRDDILRILEQTKMEILASYNARLQLESELL